MHLWNDYEGKVIAGAFTLEKLLDPQGRSALFSTTNGSGKPAAIRLTESLNDERETLDQWRAAAEVKQINLVEIHKVGETVIDDTPLVYAVMEPIDANLADLLKNRPLTIEETRHLASGLVPAMETLHASGMVHGHIEAANIFAAGEVVKLRSDCIRQAPASPEASELKAKDVHDLAAVLRHALTQRKRNSDADALPAPFAEVVRNGVSGVWGLQQIATALGIVAKPRVETARTASATKTPVAPTRSASSAASPDPSSDAARTSAAIAGGEPVSTRRAKDLDDEQDPRRKRLGIAGACLAGLVLLLLAWHLLHRAPSGQTVSANPSNASTAAIPAAAASNPPPAASLENPAKPSAARAAQTAAGGANQWRVIAYTYNHANQAQSKVAAIQKDQASLQPEVFTANGLPPYLVTLGGAMTREQAFALRDQARSQGFPRDVYAQNFSVRTH